MSKIRVAVIFGGKSNEHDVSVVSATHVIKSIPKDKYDVICSVQGGGFTGQAGAIRHGIARALNEANSEFRPALKTNGFLTRDPRMKERKKYGLKKARKAPQFSKR